MTFSNVAYWLIDRTIFWNIVLWSWCYYCDVIFYYCDIIYYCDVILYYCDIIYYCDVIFYYCDIIYYCDVILYYWDIIYYCDVILYYCLIEMSLWCYLVQAESILPFICLWLPGIADKCYHGILCHNTTIWYHNSSTILHTVEQGMVVNY